MPFVSHKMMKLRAASDFLECECPLLAHGTTKQNDYSGLMTLSGPRPESATSSLQVQAVRGPRERVWLSCHEDITLFRSSVLPPSLSGASLGFMVSTMR